jgi:hypothetical protein
MTKASPELQMRSITGEKLATPQYYEPSTIEGVKVERFVVQWILENEPIAVAYQKTPWRRSDNYSMNTART